jgi:hypothetical protein
MEAEQCEKMAGEKFAMICSLKQDDPDDFISNETNSSDLNESLVLYIFSET